MADDAYAFDEASAQAIARAVRALRLMFPDLVRRLEALEGKRDGWKPARIYICKTDEAIEALSGTTPGSGPATIYRINSSGVLESTGKQITVYNISSAEVADDTWIQVKEELASCKWIIDFEACPA